MIAPRGIVRVYAMARPRRLDSEAAAVMAAAASTGSAVARGAAVARAVVAYLARAETIPTDDVEAVARRLAATWAPSPVETLATCPAIDTAAFVRAERLTRFEARECRQLSAAAWEAETAQIMRDLEAKLTERYRKIVGANRVFANRDASRRPGARRR